MSGGSGHAGPLAGVRVLELEASGPVPFCAMLLADMGAEVLRIERPAAAVEASVLGLAPEDDILLRNRERLALDLKEPEDRRVAQALAQRAQVLIEGFRPGVAERLGLGPGELLQSNPGLVYARLTGWGQDGPMARLASHDINILAASGALAALGRDGTPPAPPLNLVADFGGGGMLAAFGVTAALYEARRSGRGQVVDVAMVDGVAAMLASLLSLRAGGAWREPRGSNVLDGGAPWYDCYTTADGRYLALGCVEPRFFAGMLALFGLGEEFAGSQLDRAAWPPLRKAIAQRVAAHDSATWTERLAGTDLCITPVIEVEEAAALLRGRGSYTAVDGRLQAAPVPRFSRTPGGIRQGVRRPRAELLAAWGLAPAQ